MSVNKAILVGRLGKDPELKFTQSGKAVCNFSLATSERYNNQEKTEWHDITTWEKTAEACNTYLKKGSQAYVEGKIQTQEWTTKEGDKRSKKIIVASTVRFLDSKSDRPAGPVQSAQPDLPTIDVNADIDGFGLTEDDLPF